MVDGADLVFLRGVDSAVVACLLLVDMVFTGGL